MFNKKVKLLLIIVLLVVLSGLAGGYLGTKIKSPAEAAARTAAPEPSPILVPIERRIVQSSLITRGIGRFGTKKEVTLPLSEFKKNVGRISNLSEPGTILNNGDLLGVVSGRPVFLLQGEIPMYRDLKFGDSGDDVLQLEVAINHMGFDCGKLDGIFDDDTSNAVSNLYKLKGWDAYYIGETQIELVNKLELDLEKSEQEILGNKIKTSELIADYNLLKNDYKVAFKSLNIANKSVTTENLNLESKLIVADIKTKKLKNVRKGVRITIDGIWTSKEDNERDLNLLKMNGESSINNAKLEVDRINGQINKIKSNILSTDEKIKVSKNTQQTIEKNRDLIKSRLEHAKSMLGANVPMDEIVYSKNFPLSVSSLILNQGDYITGPIMVVSDSQLVIDSSISIDNSKYIYNGMEVYIDEVDLGIKETGKISYVSDSPGTHGVDAYHIYIEVSLSTKITKKLDGLSVRINIPLKSSNGKVLVVPLSAISLSSNGESRIQLKGNDNLLKYSTITSGLVANGYAEILNSEIKLNDGDLVVIGFDNGGMK